MAGPLADAFQQAWRRSDQIFELFFITLSVYLAATAESR